MIETVQKNNHITILCFVYCLCLIASIWYFGLSIYIEKGYLMTLCFFLRIHSIVIAKKKCLDTLPYYLTNRKKCFRKYFSLIDNQLSTEWVEFIDLNISSYFRHIRSGWSNRWSNKCSTS
jgi:hypothetical protein